LDVLNNFIKNLLIIITINVRWSLTRSSLSVGYRWRRQCQI